METKSKGYNLGIAVNDFDLSYDDVGEGRVPVIFLHGFPFDKTMWELQLEFLKFTYRLISCDIRGFGKSTDESTPLSIDLFTDDLIKFMDKLKIEKAIVCGLSMGGYIALNAVKRFPGRFEGLVLCDTQCMAETVEGKRKRYQVIEDIEDNGAKKFNEGFIKKSFPSRFTGKQKRNRRPIDRRGLCEFSTYYYSGLESNRRALRNLHLPG